MNGDSVMSSIRSKLSSINFWILSVLILLSVGAIVCVKAIGDIPEADITYTEDWVGTLVLDSDQTVKISRINHDNTGTDSGAAIKISNNSTVSLVFEGENILVANPSKTAAGIEVENGSTVKIYGMDGSSLTVTGGNISAGIGGIGYGNGEHPAAGNINIYSGNITAIGGNKGAGIGSGNHSSASDINIMGGNIIALGTGWGAGIGSGYGTSGGAQNPGAGYYNGGNITISGGTVKAAAYHLDFDKFDPYNLETLNNVLKAGDDVNSCAAGIGGGYGASSGNIIIKDDADVIAIGSCGGAGIGSGRGTSKISQYDAERFNVNVTIKGNSKVVAIARPDTRSGQTPESGAAIGLGRGCALENEPKGTVKIEDKANVYAVALSYAQAIGGSRTVGSTVIDAHLASIDLESTTVVMATSDGQRNAIDYVEESDLANFLVIGFSNEYFENHSDFFTEDKFPLKIAAINADNPDSKTLFSIPNAGEYSFMVQISDANSYNFEIEDYKGENGETIFLSNSVEENSAQFFPDATTSKRYDAIGLTARLDRDEVMDSDYGELKAKIKAKEGIFEYGSTFFCNGIKDKAVIDELNSKLDKKYADKLERILYFNIGVRDKNGGEYTDFGGGKVKIYVEIPAGWDKDEVLALFVTSLDDENFRDSQKLEVIDGVTYLSFEIDHFSNYALFDPIVEKEEESEHGESDSEGENSGEINNDENSFLQTGDKIYIGCTILILIMVGSLILIMFLSREHGKRFKK